MCVCILSQESTEGKWCHSSQTFELPSWSERVACMCTRQLFRISRRRHICEFFRKQMDYPDFTFRFLRCVSIYFGAIETAFFPQRTHSSLFQLRHRKVVRGCFSLSLFRDMNIIRRKSFVQDVLCYSSSEKICLSKRIALNSESYVWILKSSPGVSFFLWKLCHQTKTHYESQIFSRFGCGRDEQAFGIHTKILYIIP